MKKFYEAPEIEMIRFTLQEVILSSQEGGLGDLIGGDDDPGDDLLDGGEILDP